MMLNPLLWWVNGHLCLIHGQGMVTDWLMEQNLMGYNNRQSMVDKLIIIHYSWYQLITMVDNAWYSLIVFAKHHVDSEWRLLGATSHDMSWNVRLKHPVESVSSVSECIYPKNQQWQFLVVSNPSPLLIFADQPTIDENNKKKTTGLRNNQPR